MGNKCVRRLPQWQADEPKRVGAGRRLLGALADGLVEWIWPATGAAGQRSGGLAGHYDLPTYRRRGIRIPELDREG
jgi:hypothetical protein